MKVWSDLTIKNCRIIIELHKFTVCFSHISVKSYCLNMTYTNSKRGVSIVERDHLIAEKHLFLMQECKMRLKLTFL